MKKYALSELSSDLGTIESMCIGQIISRDQAESLKKTLIEKFEDAKDMESVED